MLVIVSSGQGNEMVAGLKREQKSSLPPPVCYWGWQALSAAVGERTSVVVALAVGADGSLTASTSSAGDREGYQGCASGPPGSTVLLCRWRGHTEWLRTLSAPNPSSLGHRFRSEGQAGRILEDFPEHSIDDEWKNSSSVQSRWPVRNMILFMLVSQNRHGNLFDNGRENLISKNWKWIHHQRSALIKSILATGTTTWVITKHLSLRALPHSTSLDNEAVEKWHFEESQIKTFGF